MLKEKTPTLKPNITQDIQNFYAREDVDRDAEKIEVKPPHPRCLILSNRRQP
jgi:hypothetical protein